MPLILGTNSIKDTGYDVANSVRLNDGSSDGFSLSGQNGNRKTFTFSCWVKRGVFGENFLFNSRIDASNHFLTRFTGGHQLELLNRTSASNNFILTTNRLFRDVSAWYHIVVAVDTTQSTANDRVKFYVNGVQETSFATQTIGSQNADLSLNTSTATHYIGQEYTSGENFFDGYMAETILIDGSQLAPDQFGEFDEDSGIWKPIDVSGLTFGNNGFYLDFEDSSALGNDVSGNNNDFTVNNLTAIDQSTDTCTINFATYNSLISSQSQTYSEGNLQVATTSSGKSGGSSTIGVASGKWYAEFKVTDSNNRTTIGITSDPSELDRQNQYVGFGAYDYSYIAELGNKANNNSESSYGNSYTQNDIIGVAVDLDNNKIYFSKNGTWQNSGDPTSGATGTGSAFTLTASSSTPSGFYFFGAGDVASNQTGTIQANFGSPAYSISSGNTDGNGYGNFEYAVPENYYSLNTKNLAEYG
jgi:hypothetical protein